MNNLFLRKVEIKENNINVYPFNIPVIKNLKELEFNKPLTFIIGENGSGKSTLIEAIAVSLGFNAEGGGKNFYFKTKETHSDLHKYIKIIKGLRCPKSSYFFRAETFYNLATNIDDLDGGSFEILKAYGFKSLHEQSHGESFFAFFKNRLFNDGLYIFDEPEAALSPSRQLSFLTIINDLIKNGSQLIIATHSPILLGYPDCDIFEIDGNIMKKVEYKDTFPYFITKQFLNNPDTILKELFNEN